MRPRTRIVLSALALLAAVVGGCRAYQTAPVQWGEEAHRFHDDPGGRVHYRVVGDGPPVLLVHGFGSAMVVWNGLVKALEGEHRLILVDLPGFGLSDKRERDYSPAALARTLAGLLDALGERRPVDIVAHSWGSSVTLAFALQFPERVNRLVLTSAWIYSQQIPAFFEWARVPGVGEFIWDWFYTEQAAYKFALSFHDPDRYASPAVVDKIHEAFDRPGAVRAAHAAAAAQRFEAQETRYPTIDRPALLVWGADDIVSLPHFGRKLATDLPRARLELFEECGHMPMVEHARRYQRLVADFLAAPAVAAGGEGGAR